MISAEEAKRVWTKDDESAYTQAESAIDAEIRGSLEGSVCADLSSVHGLRRAVRESLTAAYRAGGWIVTWRDGDQRDPGPFVELHVASPPRSGPGR